MRTVHWRHVAPKRRNTLRSSVIYLGERGFHASTIARITDLTKSQVYYICRQVGVKLRAYRDGDNEIAEVVIRLTPCVKMHRRRDSRELVRS
jgi:hypothetical protein